MSNCELLHALLTRLVSYRSFLIPQLFQPTSNICKLYLPKIDTGWYHFFLMYKVCIAIQLSLEHVHCPLGQAMPATYMIV